MGRVLGLCADPGQLVRSERNGKRPHRQHGGNGERAARRERGVPHLRRARQPMRPVGGELGLAA